MITDPWGRSNHYNDGDDKGDDAPSKDDRRCVLGNMVLKRPNDQKEKPGDARHGATRVYATQMLNKTSEENTPP